MQTMTITPSIQPSTHPIRPLRFSTLTSIELRKMTDTRSGRWLLVTTLGLAATVLVWKIAHPAIPVSFDNYGGAVAHCVAFLTPIVALLAMTSEWTQRTALTTFTLTPRRLPVIGAKYVSAVILSLTVLAAGVAMAMGATAIGGLVHGHASYLDALSDIRSYAIIVVLQVTMAAAFGALAAQTAAALVGFFAAPTMWAAVSTPLLGRAAPWFDVFSAYDQLSSTRPFHHVAESITAIAIWVVLPSVIGVVYSLRREVK